MRFPVLKSLLTVSTLAALAEPVERKGGCT